MNEGGQSKIGWFWIGEEEGFEFLIPFEDFVNEWSQR